jgi:hypothetical protein
VISDSGIDQNEKNTLINQCRTWPGAQTPHAKSVVEHAVQEIQSLNPLPPETTPWPP